MENNLEIDVRNAKALGLSYGQYKALYYDPSAPMVRAKKPVKVCPVCGKEVMPPKIVVCSDECARIREGERKRAMSRKYYLIKKFEKMKEVD